MYTSDYKALRDNWLAQMRAEKHLCARDLDLLDRASATLCGNVTLPPDNAWGPYRGIVPSPSRYKGVWDWDDAFHALAVSRFDPELAYEQCEIFWACQKENGLLPDVIRADGSRMDNYSTPPVFPWAFVQVYKRSPNAEKLKKAYSHYTRYENFWHTERFDEKYGLFYHDALDTGALLLHQKWETGWDNSPRWDKGVKQYLAVDLNSYMVLFYDALTFMAREQGLERDAARWAERSAQTAQAVNRWLWSEKYDCYMDFDRFTGEHSDIYSPAAFVPLYAGAATAEYAERMAENAKNPDRFWPSIPTVGFCNAAFDAADYWRGPTWYNLAYFTTAGLNRYGYHDLAEAFREYLLRTADAEKRSIFEYYNARTGEGLGAASFGWSSAFIIELILNPEVR